MKCEQCNEQSDYVTSPNQVCLNCRNENLRETQSQRPTGADQHEIIPAVHFDNIVWDCDEEQEQHLPVNITVNNWDTEKLGDPAIDGADYLSNEYGFCVIGFWVEKALNQAT
jgi:hypothetical protein